MRVAGVIPARYRSKRFDGKALALLGGRPMIQHVYEKARRASRLAELVVATDDERIANVIQGIGGKALMTSPDHPSGTDRVAEAAAAIEADVVVNIQGDEPFISGKAIDQAVEPFLEREDVQMTTLMRTIEDEETLRDPNVVKVVVDRDGFALYFSRSPIPFARRSERFQGLRAHWTLRLSEGLSAGLCSARTDRAGVHRGAGAASSPRARLSHSGCRDDAPCRRKRRYAC